jgi:signal transduction histidine kinase
MIRLGLFQNIYLRVVMVIAATLFAMLAFSHVHQARALIASRQIDLQQEAQWFARHATSSADYSQIADAWRSMHDGVQLQIFSSTGEVLADSFADQQHLPENDGFSISAQAPIQHSADGDILVLSRGGMQFFPDTVQLELIITAALLLLLAAGLLFPLTRRLVKTFNQLSEQADRVAGGEFGQTLQVRGDRELAALITAFNSMSTRLGDAEQSNRQLLIEVSHEFRSPLGRITALVDTLKRHPDELEEHVTQIRQELELLDRLTGDALAAARFSPQAVDLELQSEPANLWVRTAFGRLAKPARIEGVNVECREQVSPGKKIEIDPDRLMQALGNLMDNAKKAICDLAEPRLLLEAEDTDTSLIIRISDNGSGVPDADKPFVFDRYFQADPSSSGSGLGLSVSKELVEAHGGQLRLFSVLSGGTTAEISLPISPS